MASKNWLSCEWEFKEIGGYVNRNISRRHIVRNRGPQPLARLLQLARRGILTVSVLTKIGHWLL